MVQVVLALVVILVIATLTFASGISGALKGKTSVYLEQTAEKLRNPLISWICNHCSRIVRFSRPYMGTQESQVVFT